MKLSILSFFLFFLALYVFSACNLFISFTIHNYIFFLVNFSLLCNLISQFNRKSISSTIPPILILLYRSFKTYIVESTFLGEIGAVYFIVLLPWSSLCSRDFSVLSQINIPQVSFCLHSSPSFKLWNLLMFPELDGEGIISLYSQLRVSPHS